VVYQSTNEQAVEPALGIGRVAEERKAKAPNSSYGVHS